MRAKNFYVGITGHRFLHDRLVIAFLEKQIKKTILDIRREHENILVLSSLAEGADTLFTKIAIGCGIVFEAVIPFLNYEEDFNTYESHKLYQNLLQEAAKIHRLRFQKRSNMAYLAGGKWVVNHCDVLIAVWNGLPAAGEGGTGDIVAYAMRKKRPIIHIHTINKTVHFINYDREKHKQV